MSGCGCNNNKMKETKKECPLCYGKSHSISYPAVKMVVKNELKDLIIGDKYYTCDNKDCEVVFFNEEGEQIFLVIDVDLGANFKEVVKDEKESCGGGCNAGCRGCQTTSEVGVR